MADPQRISVHVLDQARGRPAEGIPVTLEIRGMTGLWSLFHHDVVGAAQARQRLQHVRRAERIRRRNLGPHLTSNRS